MGQIVTEGVPADLLVVLTNPDGTPALGISFAAVQCQYLKEGDPSFNIKVLTALNFLERGQGYYVVNFDGAELSIPGAFAFTVFGAGVQQYYGEAQVRSLASTLPTTPVVLPMCRIVGNVNDLSGEPMIGAAISARVVGMPTILVSTGITDDLVTAVTDDNGAFNLSLVRLAVVDIFIPKINYRRQITVPNSASADLFMDIP